MNFLIKLLSFGGDLLFLWRKEKVTKRNIGGNSDFRV